MGGDEEHKNMHWWNWKKLSRLKQEEGMSFKDLEAFNKALLAKLGWRVIQKPTITCGMGAEGQILPISVLFKC